MGVVSGVIGAMESESEESERLFRLRLELRRLRSSETQIDGVGSRSGRMKPITMRPPKTQRLKTRLCLNTSFTLK